MECCWLSNRSFLPTTPTKIGNFVARENKSLSQWTISMQDVHESKDNPNVQLWDIRDQNEYSGELKRFDCKAPGRIPWGIRFAWQDLRNTQSQEFLDPEAMRTVLEIAGFDQTKKQYFYCHSGVRTTQAMFCLSLLGWDENLLCNYDGSWIEWSNFPTNPIICGNK